MNNALTEKGQVWTEKHKVVKTVPSGYEVCWVAKADRTASIP